jgi:hypothetical protein
VLTWAPHVVWWTNNFATFQRFRTILTGSSLTMNRRVVWSEEEEKRICWEGRGNNLTPSGKKSLEGSPLHRTSDRTWSVVLKDICRNCDLCAELKAPFQQPLAMNCESQDFFPTISVQVLGGYTSPKCVKLELFYRSSCRTILLAPSILS